MYGSDDARQFAERMVAKSYWFQHARLAGPIGPHQFTVGVAVDFAREAELVDGLAWAVAS